MVVTILTVWRTGICRALVDLDGWKRSGTPGLLEDRQNVAVKDYITAYGFLLVLKKRKAAKIGLYMNPDKCKMMISTVEHAVTG